MATAAAVGANLKARLEQLGAEMQTSAANYRKDLETIEAKRLTCSPAEIEKLMIRRDVVTTLLDRVNVSLAEREAAHGATSRELRAEEKAYEDGAPFRKIGQLMREIETDLAPMRVAFDPKKWERIQKNIFELRGMNVMNVQTTPRVNTISGNIGGEFIHNAHGPAAGEHVARIAGKLAPLYHVLAGILGR